MYEVIIHFTSPSPGEKVDGQEVPVKRGFPLWIEIVINLNHVALGINAAMNIVVYIYKDLKFRQACIDLITEWFQWAKNKLTWTKSRNAGSEAEEEQITSKRNAIYKR